MLALHEGIFTYLRDLHTAIGRAIIHRNRYRVFLVGSAAWVLEQGVAVAFAKAVVVPFKQHTVLGQIIEAIRRPRPESYRVQLLTSSKGVYTDALDAARKDDILYLLDILKGAFANVFNAVGQHDGLDAVKAFIPERKVANVSDA